jgi:hypothetical protein
MAVKNAIRRTDTDSPLMFITPIVDKKPRIDDVTPV